MLRWTGESIPAAGLLSLTSRQHDRRALWGARRVRPGLRGGRPVHRQRQRQRLGRGVPAAAPPFHRPRPPAGSALHGHCGHDEASPAKSRGRAAFDAALVFLRTAADRQAALGSAQHLQGLCRAGHPQPAAATRAQIDTGTQSRGLRARVRGSNGLTATGAHASGKLTLPQPVGGSIIRKGGWEETWLFSFFALFSSLFIFAEKGFVWEEVDGLQEQNRLNEENSYFMVLHTGILTLFEAFLNCSRGNQTRKKRTCKQKGQWVFLAMLTFDVSVFPFKFCSSTKPVGNGLIKRRQGYA